MARPAADIIVQELDDNGSTVFGWRFAVDGEIYADGLEATREEAYSKASAARREWTEKND